MSTTSGSTNRPNIMQRIIGPPIETAAAPHQAIGKLPALAIFASDALSSVAYATEEILLILAISGSLFFGLSIPIAIAIAVLLVILTISYRQTIFAYPTGGGAYIVSRENLGELAAKIAGAALMTDYILTVAVSISSGVAQISSAFPILDPYRVYLAVLIIIIMTVINMRGIKESSTTFAIPTYFFLLTAMLMLGTGFIKWITGTLDDVTGVEMVSSFSQPITLFLLLRAFSSGCTALTGVEAISNGISAFKTPRAMNAAKTMLAMSSILAVLFIGITLLAHEINAMPSETETVISQIARTVFGTGFIYVIAMAATTTILIMAANTSFADFPRLAALQAADGVLPRQLTYRGSRLVFSWGIVGLAGLASLLVVVFNASVSALIPLYAVGVFLSFTLSQSGMVIHWRQISKLAHQEEQEDDETLIGYDPSWRLKQIINIIGAIATGIVTLIFAVTKFAQGAWFILIIIPLLVWAFSRTHHHYQAVAKQLSLGGLDIKPHASLMLTIILVDNVHAGTLRLVNFAESIGHPWEAIHIAVNPEKVANILERWDERIGIGELHILPSPYRSLAEPLREYIHLRQAEHPGAFIHVIVGQLAMTTYWEQALHNNTNLFLDLLVRDMDRVVVTSVPYQVSLREQYAARLQAEISDSIPDESSTIEPAEAEGGELSASIEPIEDRDI